MKNITTDIIKNAIDLMERGNGDGTVYYKVDTLNDGRGLYLVIGYQEGYEKGEKYQKVIGDTIITMCAKIAVNIDDLQSDYDYDWYMPSTREGDVYDTDMAIGGDLENLVKYYNQEAKTISDGMNDGTLSI